MNPISYSFTMDVKKNGTQGVLSGMRSGEVGIRELRISLAYGKETLKFSGEEVAYMFVTRPSDTTPSIEGCKIEGNTIIYEISPNDVAEEGVVNCQLKIVGNKKVLLDGEYWDEEVILYAPSFEMEVTDPNVDESHIPELPVYTALEELLQEFTSRTFDAEAYASGTRNGIPVTKGDIAYQNNAKYFKDEIIEKGAEAVEESMRTAEAYAVGTRNNIPVSEGDVAYHNNSKYYAEEAHTSADNAKSAEASAVSSANYAESRVSEIEGIKNTTEALRNETEGIRQTTEGYKNDALASKNSAEVSATNASQYATNAFESANRAEGYSIESAQSAELARGYSVSAGASATEASDSADKSENEADRAEAQANRAESIASSVTPTKMSYDAETETLFFEDIGGIGELATHVDNLEERVTVLEESNADLQTRLTKTERTNKLLVEAVKDTLISFETVDSLTDQTIPTGAMEYAELQSVGGVSRKGRNLCGNITRVAEADGSYRASGVYSGNYFNFNIEIDNPFTVNNGDVIYCSCKAKLNSGSSDGYFTFRPLSVLMAYQNITSLVSGEISENYTFIKNKIEFKNLEAPVEMSRFLIQVRGTAGEEVDISAIDFMVSKEDVPYEPYTASLIDAKVDEVVYKGAIEDVFSDAQLAWLRDNVDRWRIENIAVGTFGSDEWVRMIKYDGSKYVQDAVRDSGEFKENVEWDTQEALKRRYERQTSWLHLIYANTEYIKVSSVQTVNIPPLPNYPKVIPTSILSLPDYGIGVSADCYNYVDYKERKYHRRVASVDLGSLEWKYATSEKNIFLTKYAIPNISTFASDDYAKRLTGFICQPYPADTARSLAVDDFDDKTCKRIYDGGFYIRDSGYTNDIDAFLSSISGQILYYELEAEEIIDISDLIDEDFNILSVESGGKVEYNYPSKAEYECEVPNRIEYAIKIADALGVENE